MNAEPHTHELAVTKDSDGDLYLSYGDQSRFLYRMRYWYLPLRRRDRRNLARVPAAAKRLIAKHDRESRDAGEHKDALAATVASVNANIPDSGWGSG